MEDSTQIFAVCNVNDVIKRRALGFVLARRNGEGKTVPFPIVVSREAGNFEPRQFRDSSGKRLLCGKHRDFERIVSRRPCKGERLERIEAFVDGEDVCITGVDLVEEDGLDRDENDENPEVLILPD